MYPILFQLGSFTIYAYGFFIALGFIVGLVLATLKAQKRRNSLWEYCGSLLLHGLVSHHRIENPVCLDQFR